MMYMYHYYGREKCFFFFFGFQAVDRYDLHENIDIVLSKNFQTWNRMGPKR
jgi:hypothetical protein